MIFAVCYQFEHWKKQLELACEQALGLGVSVFVGGGGGGERERDESLQRCLTNLNVSVEKVCGKC